MTQELLPFGRKRNLFRWDRKLDFLKERERIINMLRRVREKLHKVRYQKQFVKLAVLLTQLANGARISEALEAMRVFAYTRQRDIYIKSRKSHIERLIIIPPQIYDNDASIIRTHIDRITLANIKMFCKEKLGYNTHALRYAYITYLAKQGISAQIIAKITGHITLKYILYYTEKVEAEKIQRKIATSRS